MICAQAPPVCSGVLLGVGIYERIALLLCRLMMMMSYSTVALSVDYDVRDPLSQSAVSDF